jgi:hypothetical protein
MTEPIKLPPFDWHYLVDQSGVEDYARLAVEQVTADLRAELADIRAELAGGDAAALPNDYTTTQMARTIRTERDKFMWQVRDTCTRAEKAEAELATLRAANYETQSLLNGAEAELARLTTQRLWVWRNFSATKRELWVFDNPFPVYMDSGDPQTIGEPYGYALFKPSRRGRADITDEQAMEQMMRTPLPDVKEAKP